MTGPDTGDRVRAYSAVIERYRARLDADRDADPEFIRRMSTALEGVLLAVDPDLPPQLLAERLATAAYEVVYGMAHPLAALLAAIDRDPGRGASA